MVLALLTFLTSSLSTVSQAQEFIPPYITPLSIEEMSGKQGVFNTDQGIIVIDLLPEHAPNHVGLFIKLAKDGEYNGTIFHRMVSNGIIQGGDPLTKDPARIDVYGRGGLRLINAEPNKELNTRGAVSAVVVPGEPDSGGTQFLICVVDQPGLDGHHTVWARVSEGMGVVTTISESAVDDDGRALDRITVHSVSIRDKPAQKEVPFSVETDADLATYLAILETDMGQIKINFYPDLAPNHVRNFLRLASAEIFDGMAFHRVVKGFVVQTGYLPTRREPLTEFQKSLVQTLEPEFNSTNHVRGIVSMARSDNLASASTSFFICTDICDELDGLYTVFGVVVSGFDVVDSIESTPTSGETPESRIELRKVRIVTR